MSDAQGQKRFAVLSDEDKMEVLAGKNAKNTICSTKYAIRVFHDYCMQRHQYVSALAIDTLPAETLDILLESFYAEARNRNGEKYSVLTMKSIRHGINRYYNEPPLRKGFQIMDGPEFERSNEMFKAICVSLKKDGKGNTIHKPVIEADDMVKIHQYLSAWRTNNTTLMHKVWMDLMLHCCRRGREGLRDLKKDSYILKTDGSGMKFIMKNGSEVTKNHRQDQEDGIGGIIAECPSSENCPVKSFQLYIEHINPHCDALFQRPKDDFDVNDPVWFQNKPLGKNSLGSIMITISKNAHLSKPYTNHSLRATSITALDEAGFEGRDIKSVSKHKNIESVESYCRDASIVKKKKMSATLSKTLYNSTCKESSDGLKKDENFLVPVTNQQVEFNDDIDFLKDDILLASPEVDRVLREISVQPQSQVNVKNEANQSLNHMFNISNITGGVFNFYVNQPNTNSNVN